MLRYLFHLFGHGKPTSIAYEGYKRLLGATLLLGLEFLVAADVVRTVALEPTLNNVAVLGMLVVVRTFLSWSIVVENEGHWPWRHGAETMKQAVREPLESASPTLP